MKIGFVGLGKLGFPCAVAVSLKGHDVMGYDIDPAAMSNSPRQYEETAEDGRTHINTILQDSKLKFGTLAEVVNRSDIVFVSVQTPHEPRFEGTTRLTDDRVDFDYSYLVAAMQAISAVATGPKVVAVISTVLPGTLAERVLPVVSADLRICYNPFFIAMGTAIRDFLHPEFILLGVEDEAAAGLVETFYGTICDAPVYRTSVENAELIKVSYNTYIGMKIAFANVIMEVCHKLPGTDVDSVMGAIKMSGRRLISGQYLNGGMGDGGGCHPRDNIAMSSLARRLDLSFDWFDSVMRAREMQTEWLADLMDEHDLEKGIVGYAFKAESNIVTGSPALLLASILRERGNDVYLYDPIVEGVERDLSAEPPRVYLLGADHRRFRSIRLAPGSVLIDPWRMVQDAGPGVSVIPVGGRAAN